jgi:hypothetical protein
MAKKAKGEFLFRELNKARYGEARRTRPLFLPNLLRREAGDKRLEGEKQNRAYEIILKWANMESVGKLDPRKETALESEFLIEVFGEALGYTLFSEDKENWNLEPKFSVNGGTADAAIGLFDHRQKRIPCAVIELKDPTVNVDKDRFDGRTPVQQCWDYLNALPECPWGVVCNYVSFRLYHRNYTPKVYEIFALQDLREKEIFLQFYYLFQKQGFIPALGQTSRADSLLKQSTTRQREVGDELYQYYHDNRLALIHRLQTQPYNKPLDDAISIAQKLIDRIIFVAFCEDRDLLPADSIVKAWEQVPPFYRVTNPKWQNFLNLFHSIDEGNENSGIPPYDGGLFRHDDDVDNLQLEDDWTNFFKNVGGYDFQYEVNVDVLGRLFEKSIQDIEKVRRTAFFESRDEEKPQPRMIKSAERKKEGIYYTPPEFTEFIAFNTVGKLAEQQLKPIAVKYGINPDDPSSCKDAVALAKYAVESIEILRQIKIVDPACGSGAFLIQAYQILEEKYTDLVAILALSDEKQAGKLRDQIPDFILHDNIFGVDLSPAAVEIAQLSLWLRSAHRGKTLADLSKNIVCGNSLVSDPNITVHAMNWQKTFPDVFSRPNPGFDCVIGNPPWERMKLQEREFFDTSAPEIASAVSAAQRRQLIEKLQKTNSDLYQRYIVAKESAEKTLDYVRTRGRFPLTGKGDINTYAVFAELAHSIVSPAGRVGLLVPSGIATDNTTKDFFTELTDSNSLIALYDFENKAPIFPDVHRSYKFCIFLFGGSQTKTELADFLFFAHTINDLKDKERHISLSADDFKLLNPNTRTCPIFRTKDDAELTKVIYRRVPILIDENRKEGGNPWGIKFFTMFHQTNDAELFHTAEQLKADGFKRNGQLWKKRKQVFLPLYEAKMIQMFDHRAASVLIDEENWFRQGQTDETSLIQHQNPEFAVEPRWWAPQEAIDIALGKPVPPALLAFKNVTSPTNQRTMIAALIPSVGVINSAPLIRFTEQITSTMQCCLLANLNAFVLDYVARQKIGNVNLNFFLIEQFPMFPPDFYEEKCPWDKKQTLGKWISDRVLKLTCTSNDMIPLAEVAGFKPPVYKWKPDERADLMAQLDAAYFILYGIERKNVEYILFTFAGIRKESEGVFTDQSTITRILEHYDRFFAVTGKLSFL